MKDINIAIFKGEHVLGEEYPNIDFSYVEEIYKDVRNRDGRVFVASDAASLKQQIDDYHKEHPSEPVAPYFYFQETIKEVEAPLKHLPNCGWYGNKNACPGAEHCNPRK